MDVLKAPFPYFGGKSRVAAEVWARFGQVQSYVEPFFGSGANLLGQPEPIAGLETVSDTDHFVANFWRAAIADPEGLAGWCNWPINETDLHARHVWLRNVGRLLIAKCYDDCDYYDLQTAGWWVWGLSMWIGQGWCSSNTNTKKAWNKMPDVASTSSLEGVPNKRVALSGWGNSGVQQKRPSIAGHKGFVDNRRPGLAPEKTIGDSLDEIVVWFKALQARLRNVRVVCGDWQRIMGRAITENGRGICGVFMDPPYSEDAGRDPRLYATDDLQVSKAARDWAEAHGDNPAMRIAFCGYEGEHQFPANWKVFAWKASGGYSNRSGEASKGLENSKRERIWFSPHCKLPQPTLF